MINYTVHINEIFEVEAENDEEAYQRASEMICNLIDNGQLNIQETDKIKEDIDKEELENTLLLLTKNKNEIISRHSKGLIKALKGLIL
jgi:polyhydroxyalkanoate synthesis regulator phasin